MSVSSRSAHDRLLALQKRIHRTLQEQAEHLLGNPPEAIRRYEREYRQDFRKLPRRLNPVPKDELIRQIRRSDVTLVGDFHTLAQAQRTALRLLREAVHPEEHWWLGLEMIPSHHQPELDRFQNGELSEAEFLRLIRYEEEWCFPWSQYAPLIHWAIRQHVKLIALNRPREMRRPEEEDFQELHARDRWAAGLITDLFVHARSLRIRRPRMLILYGELHIGKKHIPDELARVSSRALPRRLKTLLVHQNQDSLYWKMAREGRELESGILKLKRASYCVLSSPPWARPQSIIHWIEGSPSITRPPDSGGDSYNPESEWEEDEEIGMDSLFLMRRFAQTVAEFFGVPSPSFDSLNLYTIQNADFTEHLCPGLFSTQEQRLIRYHVLHHYRIYVPSVSPLAYLATPSENGAAELASIHLFRSLLPEQPFLERTAASFYHWVLDHAFGFLGSLILNPRRKCDLIADHQSRLVQLDKNAPWAFPHEREARELATAILSSADPKDPDVIPKLEALIRKPHQLPALFFAARYVGHALAKELHFRLLRDELNAQRLKEIFLGRPAASSEETSIPAYWRYSALRKAAPGLGRDASKTEAL